MTASLRIGPGLTLPLEAVTETVAILGIRGSGKTNTAVVMSEELLSHGQQIVVIDPTDVWWGLKSSKDGERAGFPVVVLGGRHQDLPLTAADGATVADFIVDEGASVILSLRHFESQADQRKLVTDFARRLYFRKGQEGKDVPLMVLIDEASLFVPQRVGQAEAQMVGAIQKLVRQGRSSGIGVTLIDQRASTVNKDVLTQLELLICHRTSSPQDRKALEAWVEQHDADDHRAEFLKALAGLPQGTAWCWSPGWLDVFKQVPVRERKTFDSSRTPKAGERRVEPRKLAAVDLEQLRAKMAATLDRARADDPKELRRRIAELERDVRTARAERPTPSAPERVEVPVPLLDEKLVGRAETCATQLRADLASTRDAAAVLQETVTALDRLIAEARTLLRVPAAPRHEIRHPPIRTAPSSNATVPPQQRRQDTRSSARNAGSTLAGATGDARPLRKGAIRMLEAVARRHPAPTSWAQSAQLSGLARTGGTFSTYQSDLRKGGYVVERGDQLELTDAGWEAIGQEPGESAPQSTEDVLALYAGVLRGGARRMIQELIQVYPRKLTRAELGEATGIAETGGTFSTYLSDLRKAGLIAEDDGTVGASELLMDPVGAQ